MQITTDEYHNIRTIEFCCTSLVDYILSNKVDRISSQLMISGSKLKFCPYCGTRASIDIEEDKTGWTA